MTRLPSVTPRELIRALKKAGYTESRQSGSHCTLKHPTRPTVIVPVHPGDIKRGLLMRIIKQAGLSVEEIRELL